MNQRFTQNMKTIWEEIGGVRQLEKKVFHVL